MTADSDETYYLDEDVYTGIFSVDSHDIAVETTISINSELRLVPGEISGITPKNYLKISQNIQRPGKAVNEFRLQLESADGKHFTSDSVSVCKHSLSGDPKCPSGTISIDVRAATFVVPRVTKSSPYLMMRLRGFRIHPQYRSETKVGQLSISGAGGSVDCDEVTGEICIKPQSNEADLESWREEAEKFLDFVRTWLSFANGGQLQAPAVEYSNGSKIEIQLYDGEGYPAEFPVLPYLNLEPFVTSLTKRYFSDPEVPEYLGLTLGWMQVRTTYDEIRFMSGMIALEQVLSEIGLRTENKIIEKDHFNSLKKSLNECIENDSNIDANARMEFEGKISRMNQVHPHFRAQLLTLLNNLGVPKSDISDNDLTTILKLRNDIVHRGTDNKELLESISLIRELLTRFILKELNFEGNYYCYIGGRHERKFPK